MTSVTSRWQYLARLCGEARQAAKDQDPVRLHRVACRIERHALLALKDDDIIELKDDDIIEIPGTGV